MSPTTPSNPPQLGMIGLCRWALRYAFGRWLALTGVLGSMLLQNGLDLLKPWPMAILIDYVLGGKKPDGWVARLVESLPGSHDQSSLIAWSVGSTVVIFLLSWLVQLAGAYANISFGQRIIYDLAGHLYFKLQRLSLRFHASKSVGDNIRRVTSDCSCVATIVRDAIIPLLSASVSLVAMFLILRRIDEVLTILALVIVPYMVLIFLRYAKPMMDRSYQQQEVESRGYELIEQSFSAIPVVQAFTGEEENNRRFKMNLGDTLKVTLSLTHIQLQFKVLMGLATAVGTSGVLWIGARHVLAGSLSVGDMFAFLTYLVSFYTPLEAIMYTSSTIQGAAGSARRVLEVLNTKTEITDKVGAPALPPSKGKVQFENITFGYEKDRTILRNISLDVQSGETIALIGTTGAGKSTLASMIPRFLDPWEGRVLIDGQDAREVRLKTLRSQVGIVLQEPFLFPLTIGGNIAYGNPQATLAEIESAAKVANAHDFIQKLPKKYDTVIGERGSTLSGGERQRVAIARALLKNAPILILDEPTSALDAETEAAFMQALGKLIRNRTTFIIAHRLSTIRYADRIVVLKEGQIAEIGNHDQLLALNGIYTHLHKLQSA